MKPRRPGIMRLEPVVSGRFSTITLTEAQFPQSIRGRVGGIEPVTFTFNTNAFRARLPAFLGIQANRLNGGQPQRTLSGRGIAIADVGAHLVRLTVTEGAELQATGVITIPQVNLGPGGHRVTSVSVVFHQADELRFYGSTAVEQVP